MTLNALEVGQVAAELAPRWQGAQIQKVHMRGPRMLYLSLRKPGESGVLTLSVEPSRAYLAVLPERGESDPEASGFCMALRRALKGSRLEHVGQVGEDRLIEVRAPRGVLVAELLGRRGAFVLCDPAGTVQACSPASALRAGLERGKAYQPPSGGGRPPGGSRLQPGQANEGVRALIARTEVEDDTGSRRAQLTRALDTRVTRARRRLTHVEEDIARAGDHRDLQHQGELLKIRLGEVERGMRSITVDDLIGGSGAPVEIALDPSLGPAANLERLFARARKARRTREVAAGRLAEVRADLERLEALRTRLAAATDEQDLTAIAAESGLPVAARTAARRSGPEPRQPYRTHRDARGRRILVGRSAGDNDRLTQDVARPHDMWLHARGYPGSHVVVPLEKGEQIDTERLLDAATLAAHFSEGRGNTSVEVTYTLKRFVQKPRKAPRGQVALLDEKVILLRLEPERLRRLLETRDDS